jgi:pimeloyl-ACP methyl ester carboxylesterase
LRPSADSDGFVLTCTPENEAAIYAEALTLNLWPRADAFGGPVKLIGADPNMTSGPPTALTNQALGIENGYDYDFVPGAGHMLQIEKPAECVRLVKGFLEKCGIG